MRILAACGLILLCSTVAPAQFRLSFDREERSWSIENGLARAVFQLTAGGTFEFRSFTCLSSGDVWTPPGGASSSLIRLQTDNAVFDENTHFKLVRQGSRSGARRSFRHVIELEDERALGRFVLELEMYEGQPVLRYRVRFQNIRPQPIRVTAADMLPWRF